MMVRSREESTRGAAPHGERTDGVGTSLSGAGRGAAYGRALHGMSYAQGRDFLSPRGGAGSAAAALVPVQTKVTAPVSDAAGAPAAEPAGPRSFNHWVQDSLNGANALQAFMDRPLDVDGVIGAQSKRAIRRFQTAVPQLLPGEAPLSADGIVGPATTGALERATGQKNPFGRPAGDPAAPKAEEPQPATGDEDVTSSAPVNSPKEPATAARRTDAAEGDSSAAPESKDTADTAAVQAELRAEIDVLAAAKRKRGLDPDVGKAYEQARLWTMERLSRMDTDRAKSVEQKLTAKWAAARDKHTAWVEAGQPSGKRKPQDPGDRGAYLRRHWFRAYWFRWCYQFAAKVQSFLGGRHPSLMTLVGAAIKSNEAGEEGKVKGRTTLYRGLTLAEVAQLERDNPQLAPGAAIHVKMSWEIDAPYTPKDDFHHWVIYAGDGKFSDTLTGQNKPGAAHDRVLASWVRSAFKHKDYTHLHDDPRFVLERRRGLPIPHPGLQPRVTDEYDPRQAVNKRTK